MNDPAVLTVAETAALLRMSRGTLYGQIRSGRFPIDPIPTGTAKIVFSRRRVLALIEGETDPAPTQREAVSA